jgi:site-specific recombinase XerD
MVTLPSRVSNRRLRQWMNQSVQRAGLKAWPHLLRHAASIGIARQTDPKTWMNFMNHADLSQYGRYVATTNERLRDDMRRSLSRLDSAA